MKNQRDLHRRAAPHRMLAALTAGLLLLTAGCASAAPVTEPAGSGSEAEYLACGSEELVRLTASERFNSDRTPEAPDKALADDTAEMGVKLLRACLKDADGSVLISPLSVLTALTMTANGARGETLTQLCDFLGEDIDTLDQRLFDFYSSAGTDDALSASDSVWLTSSPSFSVSRDFLKIMENTFRSDIFGVNFSLPDRLCDAVNGYCSEKTKGMIPRTLEPSDVSPDTVMLLINTLCFGSEWETPFTEDQCTEGYFSGTRATVRVAMMKSTERLYISGKTVTGFVKPYAGGRYAFAALLPKEGYSPEQVLEKLTGKDLTGLIRKARKTEVDIGLPNFTADSSFRLENILPGLGLTLPFDPSAADFSGLGCFPGENDANLYIGSVIHKTHAEVDRDGTRAAAVTVVEMRKYGAGPVLPTRPAVILNRPFIYAIIDTETSLPVFLGVCEELPALETAVN